MTTFTKLKESRKSVEMRLDLLIALQMATLAFFLVLLVQRHN
jgi:hypothetical protein